MIIDVNFRSQFINTDLSLLFLHYLCFWYLKVNFLNPFAPGDFAEQRVLKLVEWFSGYCRAIKS